MPKAKFAFENTVNMFGNTIDLVEQLSNTRINLCQSFPGPDPLKNRISRMKTGYFFRCPSIKTTDWVPLFSTLADTQGRFKLWVERSDTDPSQLRAYIKFATEFDASVFTWTHDENWQKWSDAEDRESRKAPKKAKIFRTKDGQIKVRVHVNTLKDQ
jgi:hypothetical protein